MSIFNLESEKIKFSVVDEIIDCSGKQFIVEVKFTKDFFYRYLNRHRKKLIVNLADKSAITEREMQVLKCISQGKNNSEIAKSLNVSVHTAKLHVQNILKKLYVSDRTAAVVAAIKQGLIKL